MYYKTILRICQENFAASLRKLFRVLDDIDRIEYYGH